MSDRQGFGPKVQPRWVRPGARKQELTLISELERTVTHWDAKAQRSRRCGGAGCELCSLGCQKQLRVYVMGIDGAGNDWLFELRERHREQFDQYDSTVGLVVNIWRAGQARNSPIEVRVTGTRGVAERDISQLVGHFGLEALTRCSTPAFESPAATIVEEIDRHAPVDATW